MPLEYGHVVPQEHFLLGPATMCGEKDPGILNGHGPRHKIIFPTLPSSSNNPRIDMI